MHDILQEDDGASRGAGWPAGTPALLDAGILSLVPTQLAELQELAAAFEELPGSGGGVVAALDALAPRFGMKFQTIRTKFYRWKKRGLVGLVVKTRCPKLWNAKNPALSDHDREQVKMWCEKFQRNSMAAIRAMMDGWRRQSIPAELEQRGLCVPTSDMPVNPLTGFPRGWGSDGRNLLRYAPNDFERKAARQGRAAAAAHRPLVYTSRRNLYVGQIRQWDDMWHDFEVVEFDRRKRGRPLEFHGMDLASAHMFSWGFRVRIQRDDGSHDGLRGSDFRMLLAAAYTQTGYHPDGTEEIIEHGTAAIPESLERLLWDATKAIKFRRGGMTGDPALSGQYYGRPRGNFRVKAALESMHNLIHNETGALPGNTGKDRQHAPEWMHDGGRLLDAGTGKPMRAFGLLKHVDALLDAAARLPEEIVEMLRFPLLTTAQAHHVLANIYARISEHRHHALEGWDLHYVPCAQSGDMRKMTRAEVYRRGCKRLRPLAPETVSLIFSSDEKFMAANAVERTVRNGMIELHDAELSGDVFRFDAHAAPDRGKFLTVLNPFAAGTLWLFDARGGFAGTLPLIDKPCAGDADAVHRRIGAAAKTEAAMLADGRRRNLAEAGVKLAMHEHNTRVLGGRTPGELRAEERREGRAVDAGRAILSSDEERPTPNAQRPTPNEGAEDWSDAPAAQTACTPDAETW